MNPLDQFVRDLVVGDVPPPQEHVGPLQHLVREAVPGLVQGGGPDLRDAALPQRVRQGAVDAVGVEFGGLRVSLLVPVLVPDRDARRFDRVGQG